MLAVFGGFILGDAPTISSSASDWAARSSSTRSSCRTVLVPALMHQIRQGELVLPQWLDRVNAALLRGPDDDSWAVEHGESLTRSSCPPSEGGYSAGEQLGPGAGHAARPGRAGAYGQDLADADPVRFERGAEPAMYSSQIAGRGRHWSRGRRRPIRFEVGHPRPAGLGRISRNDSTSRTSKPAPSSASTITLRSHELTVREERSGR